MTYAVIRKWRENLVRGTPDHREIVRRTFLPRVVFDFWYADHCYEESDVIGQWMDDGGRDAVA